MLRRAWKCTKTNPRRTATFASMGPCSVEHGNRGNGNGAAGHVVASMGPCSVEHGNRFRSCSSVGLTSCFNGAMLRRAWKFGRGKLHLTRATNGFNGAMLRRAWKSQRGHRALNELLGFNGAMLRRAWKFGRRDSCKNLSTVASMGPCSVEHGNRKRTLELAVIAEASMGPCSVEHGNGAHHCGSLVASRARFNGAMLRRAWKYVSPTGNSASWPCFNGAMLRRAWKSIFFTEVVDYDGSFNGAMLRRAWKCR